MVSTEPSSAEVICDPPGPTSAGAIRVRRCAAWVGLVAHPVALLRGSPP